MSEEPEWRVGGKVPRNIYFKNEPTAVAVGAKPEAERVAAGIVAMMNARDELLHLALALQDPCEMGCGELGRCERCTRRSSIGERVGELVLAGGVD